MSINKEYIKELLNKEDPIILDIGCYDGNDSEILSRMFKHPTIFCFEADPKAQKLFENVNKNNIYTILYKCAMGNTNGDVTFYLSIDAKTKLQSGNSSSLKLAKNHLKYFSHIEFESAHVPCVKLDTWYDEILKSKIIDFIWADVNGGEEDLILGGINTIKNKTRYLYIEYSDDELWENQIKLQQILDYLPGFFMKNKYPKSYYGDVLLENKSLL